MTTKLRALLTTSLFTMAVVWPTLLAAGPDIPWPWVI